jgi:hypothetical protein
MTEHLEPRVPHWTRILWPRLVAERKRLRNKHYRLGLIWQPKRRDWPAAKRLLPVHIRDKWGER